MCKDWKVTRSQDCVWNRNEQREDGDEDVKDDTSWDIESRSIGVEDIGD